MLGQRSNASNALSTTVQRLTGYKGPRAISVLSRYQNEALNDRRLNMFERSPGWRAGRGGGEERGRRGSFVEVWAPAEVVPL